MYSIVYDDEFMANLNDIIMFIATDNANRAFMFRDSLMCEIDKIAFMPYRFAKNQKLGREDIRQMIFKGYIIPFRIHGDTIKILSIFKQNKSRFR